MLSQRPFAPILRLPPSFSNGRLQSPSRMSVPALIYCSVCGELCSRNGSTDDLRQHIAARHAPPSPLTLCCYCGSQTSNDAALRSHYAQKHSEKPVPTVRPCNCFHVYIHYVYVTSRDQRTQRHVVVHPWRQFEFEAHSSGRLSGTKLNGMTVFIT